MRQRFVTPS
jgi:hypothetical protein